MKNRFLTLLLAAALLPLGLSAQYRTPSLTDLDDSETVSALKDHVSYLCSPTLEGRAAGSEGELSAALYVTDMLKQYGVSILSDEQSGDLFGLKQESGDTLTSRNVIGYIPGYNRSLKDHYIVVGARLDGLGMREVTIDGQRRQVMFPSAGAGASGVAMLLELSRKLSSSQLLLGRSVLIVAFGASQQTFAGSWYFLNRSFGDVSAIDAMIDLEALGTGEDDFYAYSVSNKGMNATVEALNHTLQPVKPQITASQMYPSDQMAFYDKGIPSVMFNTGLYHEYLTPRDTPEILRYDQMETQLEYIFNYTVSLSNGPKPVFNMEEELKDRKSSDPAVVSYYDCDYRPSFLGSTDPKVFLEKWVYQYLKYPQSAVQDGVQGRVLVDFVIDEKGRVTSVKVLKGVDERLDAEAVRVIEGSPNWKPGIVGGKKVRAEISLWIEFRLERKGKR